MSSKQSICKDNTLYRLKQDQKNKFRVIKTPFIEMVRTYILNKYGSDLDYILNERVVLN